MKRTRQLIVNADEFGRSPGINRGIVEAHEAGIVTSASAMVRRPAAEGAAEAARIHPRLSVGLHVDLGEWNCRDGRWIQVEEVVDPEDAEAVERETLRQLETFRTLFGRDPTHLDSHQNVHRSGPCMAVLVTVARRLRVPLRRFTPGIRVCSRFYGQTSRGEPYPEGITVEHLLTLLLHLPAGTTELICHPATNDDGGDSYGSARTLELATLTDPRVPAALRAEGIELRSFRDLSTFPVEGTRGVRSTESALRAEGQAAFRRGDFRRAQDWFEKAVVLGGDRPWPWLWLARALLRNGDASASREAIYQALALHPGWPQGLLHLVDLHLESGRWGEAAELLQGLANRDGPGEPDLPEGVARRIRRLEDPARALEVAEALSASHPDDPRARAARAVALWQGGAPHEARRSVVPDGNTNDGDALRAAAEFHLEVGEHEVAWSYLRRIPEEDRPARLLGQVAQGLRRTGKLTRAWEVFEEALNHAPRETSLRHWRNVVVGEVQVLSGATALSPPPLLHYRPVPGRILHIVGRSLPYMQTGYSVRTRYVTQCQKEAGLDPHVVTQVGFPWTDGAEEAPLWEEVAGIAHHRLPGPSLPPERLDDRLEANLAGLVGLVRRLRPAALHAASDYRNALLALSVGRACGIPVVYEVRGFWEDTWTSKQEGDDADQTVAYRWRRERELACMGSADRVVTLAEVMRDEISRRGIPAEKVVVVPNAVDPFAFQPAKRDPEAARRLGIGEDEVVIGYVSSFVPYEGIHFLIDAVAELASRGLPVRGLLVGDGKERPALEARVRERGMEERILFTGRVPHAEVATYYGLIDAFVVPRTADRVCRLVTPLKPYEAMAMERAVVVSGVEALEEMVIPGKTGMVFRPEDAGSLADVLEPLVRFQERRRELGRSAREWVCRHRTWERNGRIYADLYRSLHVLPADATGATMGLHPNGPGPWTRSVDRAATALKTAGTGNR
jgi:glycosyltransferase involved in cell wall biosynthesis/predicted glycoside hydrolase/deacetylase ChbG (UPF0249 family)/Flp pilus assembly protein TadD